MNAKQYTLIGWPVFILDTALQLKNPHQKWKERARVGIYFGKSPQHDRNISLVLSLTTGLVSPQFHVKHDPSFDMVLQQTFKSNWQTKAGFVTKREIKKGLRNIILPITKNPKPPSKQNQVPKHLSNKKRRSVTLADQKIKQGKKNSSKQKIEIFSSRRRIHSCK